MRLSRPSKCGLALWLVTAWCWLYTWSWGYLHWQYIPIGDPVTSRRNAEPTFKDTPEDHASSSGYNFHDRHNPYDNHHMLWLETPSNAVGLGNQMFAYASLLGIARPLGFIPVIADSSWLLRVFRLPSAVVVNETTLKGKAWTTFMEIHPNRYHKRTGKLPTDVDVKLVGYFQSWKYFAQLQDTIRHEFTFHERIKSEARHFIFNSLQHEELGSYISAADHSDLVKIGVHIRRGDMAAREKHGYTVSSVGYVRRAVKLFKHNFTESGKRVVFIVCSDPSPESRQWARETLAATGAPVVFSDNTNTALDLAILSQCDHVIQTVGTFSWWAAWLTGAYSVYDLGFPKPKSILSIGFRKTDYYLPHWTGLS